MATLLAQQSAVKLTNGTRMSLGERGKRALAEAERLKRSLESKMKNQGDTNNKLSDLRLTLQNFQDELGRKNFQLARAQQDLESSYVQRRDMQRDMSEKEREFEMTRETLNKVKKELTSMEGELGHTRSKLSSARKRGDELEGMKEELRVAKNKISTLKLEVQMGGDKLAETKRELQNTKKEVSTLQSQARVDRETLAEMRKELEITEEKVSALQSQAEEKVKELERTEKELSAAKNRLSELDRSQVESRSRREGQIEEQAVARAQEIADLKRDLSRARRDLEKANAILTNAKLEEGRLWKEGWEAQNRLHDQRGAPEKVRRVREGRSGRESADVRGRELTSVILERNSEAKRSSSCCAVM